MSGAIRRFLFPTPADAIMVGLLVCATVAVIGIEVAFRHYGLEGPYWAFFSNFFVISYALMSVWIMHAWCVRSWREISVMAGMVAVLWLLFEAADFPSVQHPLQKLAYSMALGSGLVQLAGLAWSISDPDALVTRIRLARDSLMFAIASLLPGPVITVSNILNPTLDHAAAHFDDAYGFRFISLIRWTMSAYPVLHEAFFVIYLSSPIAIVMFFALQRRSLPLLPLTVWLSSAAGVALYFMLPVAGPEYAYPYYYLWLWPVADVDAGLAPVVTTFVPRNCMPSLHAAWAYLFIFSTYGSSRPIKLAGIIVATLTLISAIEIGNHWFVDLVVALPFALAIQAFACFSLPFRESERLRALLAGTGLTAVQIALLLVQPLVFPGSIAFYWAIFIATIWIVAACWIRLARRLERADRHKPATQWRPRLMEAAASPSG